MSDNVPECEKCHSPYTYHDRDMVVCPECGHEWDSNIIIEEDNVYDANNNLLADGDTVILIKDLKVKGSSTPLKKGTKVKNIRLRPHHNHNIDCKIDEFGAMELKSEYVKKA